MDTLLLLEVLMNIPNCGHPKGHTFNTEIIDFLLSDEKKEYNQLIYKYVFLQL